MWYAALFHEHDVAPTPDQLREAVGVSADYAAYVAIQRGQVGMWIGAASQLRAGAESRRRGLELSEKG